MELRQLRYVLALAESGNFHKASEALGLTQPALTKSIQHIEHDLGVRLFDRHGKVVVPTAFGEIVMRAAQQVADALGGMSRAIEQTASLDTGELNVGAGAYVADVWMGQVSERVLRQYPRLRIRLHVDHWATLPDMLCLGSIDLFIASIEHVRGRKEFRVVEFSPQKGIWVCRSGHPLAEQPQPRVSALKNYTLVGPQVPDSIRQWLENGSKDPHLLERKIDTTSITMIKAMIREGDAVSLVHPETVRTEVASGEFAILSFDAPPLFFQPGLVWLADRSLSPAASAFARELLIEVGLNQELLT